MRFLFLLARLCWRCPGSRSARSHGRHRVPRAAPCSVLAASLPVLCSIGQAPGELLPWAAHPHLCPPGPGTQHLLAQHWQSLSPLRGFERVWDVTVPHATSLVLRRILASTLTGFFPHEQAPGQSWCPASGRGARQVCPRDGVCGKQGSTGIRNTLPESESLISKSAGKAM